MGLSALQSFSQDKAISMRSKQFFTPSRFRDFLSWVSSSTAHISDGEYVRTFTSDCQLRPQTDLNAAVFRVSSYPLDDFLPPKAYATMLQATSTHEVDATACWNPKRNRIILSNDSFLSCCLIMERGYLLDNVSNVLNFRGLLLR
jgi:hypothetical protein